MSYEKLSYQLISKNNHIETRRYESFIMMRVNKKNSNQGFGVLFQYISGNNSEKQKIQMTVPVLTDLSSTEYIAFTMPKEFHTKYPDPINNDIEIIEIPQKDYLAITFKGSNRQVEQAHDELKSYASLNEINLAGDAILLRYQGPLTLPMFRINEVIIEIEKK